MHDVSERLMSPMYSPVTELALIAPTDTREAAESLYSHVLETAKQRSTAASLSPRTSSRVM